MREKRLVLAPGFRALGSFCCLWSCGEAAHRGGNMEAGNTAHFLAAKKGERGRKKDRQRDRKREGQRREEGEEEEEKRKEEKTRREGRGDRGGEFVKWSYWVSSD